MRFLPTHLPTNPRRNKMKSEELPGQSDKEVPCSEHPNAPHGFDRNGSHNNGRYTCDCEGWIEEEEEDESNRQ